MSVASSATARFQPMALDMRRLGRWHGAFNVVGGAWPMVSVRSFEAVFGPKSDRWLEYTVAGLLVSSGVSQISAVRGSRDPRVARDIGVATALTLLTIDLIYVPRGTIRWTYLIDAAMEIGWLAFWTQSTMKTRAMADYGKHSGLREVPLTRS